MIPPAWPWRWMYGARQRAAYQTLCWAVDLDSSYQGA